MAGEGENTGEQNNTGEGGKGGDGKDAGDKGFKPITYSTQAEMDAAFADRATRAAEAAKAEATKAFTDLGLTPEQAVEYAKQAKEAEDAKKDPTVREREAHEQTQRELAAYKAKEARDKLSGEVAKDLKVGEHPIPASLLAGTTKEEMAEHGKAIIAFIEQIAGKPGPRAPGYNPDQGNNHQDQVKTGDPVRNFFETGSFV